MRITLFILLVAASFPPFLAADGGMKPFTLDHRGGAASVIDLSFLLDAPAGKHGFARIAGGHLVAGDGKRLRLVQDRYVPFDVHGKPMSEVSVRPVPVAIETSETAESREFNEILRRDGAKAAIAWRSARAAQPPAGKAS